RPDHCSSGTFHAGFVESWGGRRAVAAATQELIRIRITSAIRSECSRLLLAEDIRPDGFGLDLPLLDLQLTEDGLQPDIDLVPLVFQIAKGAFVQFAQVAKRSGAAQQAVHLILARVGEFDPGNDHLQSLRLRALL